MSEAMFCNIIIVILPVNVQRQLAIIPIMNTHYLLEMIGRLENVQVQYETKRNKDYRNFDEHRPKSVPVSQTEARRQRVERPVENQKKNTKEQYNKYDRGEGSSRQNEKSEPILEKEPNHRSTDSDAQSQGSSPRNRNPNEYNRGREHRKIQWKTRPLSGGLSLVLREVQKRSSLPLSHQNIGKDLDDLSADKNHSSDDQVHKGQDFDFINHCKNIKNMGRSEVIID